MAHQLVPVKADNLQFYQYPFLDITFTLKPQKALPDFLQVLNVIVRDDQSAAAVLSKLIDSGRKRGVLLLVASAIPNQSALPEVHRLTYAVFSLPKNGNVYFTPLSAAAYDADSLFRIFGLRF